MVTETVTIRQDTCTLMLYLPELTGLPIKNIRKIFAMILSDPQTNEEAIHTLGQYLDGAVAVSKASWDVASSTCQKEWRLVEKPLGRRTRKEIKTAAAIKANNTALIRAVKQSKAQHERWVKVQSLWRDASNG